MLLGQDFFEELQITKVNCRQTLYSWAALVYRDDELVDADELEVLGEYEGDDEESDS
jgi:hypothetical protein